MFNFFCVISFACIGGFEASILLSPNNPHGQFLKISDEPLSQWGSHIKDFIDLIDLDQLMTIVMEYISESEVQAFVQFVLSPEFANIIQEFESIDEFVEAVYFLEKKGYQVAAAIDEINSFLDIPPFQKPKILLRKRKGIANLIEDILKVLPGSEIKELFEQKLENNPEVAQLFQVINSEEFMDIMRRMSQNPKFKQIVAIFQSFGFDSKYFCDMIKKIFGGYYQGVFCE